MPKLNLKTAETTRVQLTQKQQKQIQTLYKNASKEIAKKAKQAPKVSSDALKKQYFEVLKSQLEEQLNKISAELDPTITSNMKAVASAVVESNLSYFKNVGLPVEGALSHVPDEVVKAIATGQVYEGKWSLSKALWKDHMKTQYNVNNVIAQGVAENKSAYDIAKDLEKYLNPDSAKEWDWSKVYPGSSKKIDYNAQRLARTLVSHAYQQAFVKTTQNNPFVSKYQWLSAGGARTCQICADRDGKYFGKYELPLDHPNGMCTFVAVTEQSMVEVADRIADWAYGAKDPELDKWVEFLTGEKQVPTFSKLQEEWLGGHGWSPDNMPSNFKEFVTSLSSSEQADLLELAGTSWSDPHPYQAMQKYYLENLAKVHTAAKPKIPSLGALTNQHSISGVPDYNTWIQKCKKQTEEQMLKWETRAFKDMTQAEKNALQKYTGTAYQEMNGFLRTRKKLGESAAKDEWGTTYLRYINSAVSALKKAATEEDLVLRRGTGFSDLAEIVGVPKSTLMSMTIDELRTNYVGTQGTLAGFTSTSSLWDRGFSKSVEMVFFAPKGTAGSSIMNLSQYGTGEGETLLNAGTAVEVVGIEPSDGHMGSSTRIFLRVLGEKA